MKPTSLARYLLFCALIWLGQPVLAEDPQLQAQPRKCVALKQGNTCYQDIDVFWRTPAAGHYCLYLQTRDSPLECWQDSRQGKYEFEFAEAASANLLLRDEKNNRLVEQIEIEVKWVYSSRRKTSAWRVF